MGVYHDRDQDLFSGRLIHGAEMAGGGLLRSEC